MTKFFFPGYISRMQSLLNLNYDWLHSQIIYNSPRPLYKLVVVKAAHSLYYREAVGLWISKETFNTIHENIQMLPLPEKLRNSIALMTEFMYAQLLEFRKFLPKFYDEDWCEILKNNIKWTSQGTIDKWKSAEALTKDEDLNVTPRFLIALEFCLVHRMKALYRRIPCNSFIDDDTSFDKISGMDGIVKIKKHFNVPQLEQNYKASFIKMAESKNQLGCHYFWQCLLEYEKIEVSVKNNLLFVFTHSDTERKLQLLQNKENCFALLTQLLEVQWLLDFESCIEDGLKCLTLTAVVKLLDDSATKAKSSKSVKTKYVEICFMILQHFFKEYSIIILQNDVTGQLNSGLLNDVNNLIMKALYSLVEAGEKKMMKIFLESVNSKWIQKQFTTDSYKLNLSPFILASLECGMIEFVFSCAFPTAEEKSKFLSKCSRIDQTIYKLFSKNQMDNINRLLSLLFSTSEDIRNYKIKFAEKEGYKLCYDLIRDLKWESVNNFLQWRFTSVDKINIYKLKFAKDRGFDLCSSLLMDENWQSADKFVRWCFSSEEEMICFYNKFFRSHDFTILFNDYEMDCGETLSSPVVIYFLEDHIKGVASLIKLNSLNAKLNNEEIMHEACESIFSQNYVNYFCGIHLNKAEVLFEAIDTFLLALFNDDQTILTDLKKKLFTDKAKKLYISLPLSFLRELKDTQSTFLEDMGTPKYSDELLVWVQMIDHFFSWFCSSDENLKSELEEEFWNEEEIVEAKKSLKSKSENFEIVRSNARKRRRIC